MGTKQLLTIDTLDDRREIHTLLSKLEPRTRINFLSWACRQAPQGRGKLPVPAVFQMQTTLRDSYRCDRADERLTNEIYADILSLCANFGVDVMTVANEAVKWVRDPNHRRAALFALSSESAKAPGAGSRTSGTGSSAPKGCPRSSRTPKPS